MFSGIYQNFVKWDKYGERYPTWGSAVSPLGNDSRNPSVGEALYVCAEFDSDITLPG